MADRMGEAGSLRHRLVWQRQADTSDPMNEPGGDWTTLTTIWADVEPLGGRELWNARQVKATSTHRITARGGARTVGSPPAATQIRASDRFSFEGTGRVFNIVVINALRATGDARFPLLAGIASMWGVWVPLAWFLGIHSGLGVTGIWLSMCCDEWLRGLLMYHRWKQRHWVQHARQSRQALQPSG